MLSLSIIHKDQFSIQILYSLRIYFSGLKAVDEPHASDIGAHRMTISWSPVTTTSPVIRYILEYKEESSIVWSSVKHFINGTRYTIEGLNWMASYHFRVSAVDETGQGPPSVTSKGKTFQQKMFHVSI